MAGRRVQGGWGTGPRDLAPTFISAVARVQSSVEGLHLRWEQPPSFEVPEGREMAGHTQGGGFRRSELALDTQNPPWPRN